MLLFIKIEEIQIKGKLKYICVSYVISGRQ